MYKVFIIEDEYLIRNNLREQITVFNYRLTARHHSD